MSVHRGRHTCIYVLHTYCSSLVGQFGSSLHDLTARGAWPIVVRLLLRSWRWRLQLQSLATAGCGQHHAQRPPVPACAPKRVHTAQRVHTAHRATPCSTLRPAWPSSCFAMLCQSGSRRACGGSAAILSCSLATTLLSADLPKQRCSGQACADASAVCGCGVAHAACDEVAWPCPFNNTLEGHM